MSEKRFSLEYYDNMSYVKDNFNDNEYYLYWAVELMNELYEENEQLKKQNIEYEEVQCKIMNYIIDKGLGSEFAKFLREAEDE